jgi:hypothetical protein
MTVFDAAAEVFGESRFGSGWFDRTTAGGSLHICAVDPSQEEIIELDETANAAGWGLTVVCVRYSYAELLAFFEALSIQELPGDDVWASQGVDGRHNVIRVGLRRLDPDAMEYVRERLPIDAVRFEIEPRAPRAIAL